MHGNPSPFEAEFMKRLVIFYLACSPCGVLWAGELFAFRVSCERRVKNSNSGELSSCWWGVSVALLRLQGAVQARETS